MAAKKSPAKTIARKAAGDARPTTPQKSAAPVRPRSRGAAPSSKPAKACPIAIVRERIAVVMGDSRRMAEEGEYAVSCGDDCRLCFHNERTGAEFRLSVDTLLQHLAEGRVRMKTGAPLPKLP